MSDQSVSEPVLRRPVVQAVPGQRASGKVVASGLLGVSHRLSGSKRRKAAAAGAAAEPPSEEDQIWGVNAVVGLHVPPGSNQKSQELKADLGDGQGLRSRFTFKEVKLAWQILVQTARIFDQRALRYVVFPDLLRWVEQGEPGAADFLELCNAAARHAPNCGDFLRLIQLGALLRQQEAAIGSSEQLPQVPGQPGGKQLPQVPGQPGGERTAVERLREQLAREAPLRLRLGLPPRSGTPAHVFGSETADFLDFCAQRLFDAPFPGAARRDRVVALRDRMQREGVRAGPELEAAVAALVASRQVVCCIQLKDARLYGKSELPSREQLLQLAEGHAGLWLAFDHSAPCTLMDPAGPQRRPPALGSEEQPGDLQFTSGFNMPFGGLPWPNALNGPKSCGVFISLPQLLARHPDLETRQKPGPRRHLRGWRRLGQLGGYVVHIRGDGQPAAVLTLEQWAGLRTHEWFALRLRAEMEREFRAEREGAELACSCQRCGSSETAQAECLSGELSDGFALHLYRTHGEGATQAALRCLGPATRPLLHGSLPLRRLRCCAAPGQTHFRMAEPALAAVGLAAGGVQQPAAVGDEQQAAAEAAAAQDDEAAADALSARDEAAVGESDADGAAAQRPPLQLAAVAREALAFAARFLGDQCECPPSHLHEAARRRRALRALCGLWRSWGAIPEEVQHELLRMLGFKAATAAAAEEAGAEGPQTPDPPASGQRSGGSDDDEPAAQRFVSSWLIPRHCRGCWQCGVYDPDTGRFTSTMPIGFGVGITTLQMATNTLWGHVGQRPPGSSGRS